MIDDLIKQLRRDEGCVLINPSSGAGPASSPQAHQSIRRALAHGTVVC
jgi:hypothetical protein